MQAVDMQAVHDAVAELSLSYPTDPQIDKIQAMTFTSLQRHGYGHLIQHQAQSEHNRHREVGGSSRGQTHMFHDSEEEFNIPMSGPDPSQEGPSSQEEFNIPQADPFTTVSPVSHYYRRRQRRPRLEIQELDRIDESGS